MKKQIAAALTPFLCLALIIGSYGCANGQVQEPATPEPTIAETIAPTAEPTQAPVQTEAPAEDTYYIAGNFNGYSPNDSNYALTPVEGAEGVYAITVSLTKELRDPTYDGHWYKITDGTWDNSWGTECSALQPAPVKYTEGGEPIGLGSIWIDADGDYTVIWDTVNQKIYDTSMVQELSPRIYGDFNTALGKGADWGFTDDDAILLSQTDVEGIYSGEVTLPAYSGNGEGYSMVLLIKVQVSAYLPWFGWGAVEQYLFDGNPAGMGVVSYLKPTAEATYVFTYDSATHITTVSEK